jgi:uncharacterized protein (TIGR00730 family)
MKRVCVFAGSSSGAHPDYRTSAQALGRALVQRGLGLVYGGASVGLMGELADAALDAGGHVTGVIPEDLVAKELAHTGLSDLRIVTSMHERKAAMSDLSDGFIALPGGWGTLEEFFEVLTWGQLGLHRKPCGVLNVRGYFDGLLAFIDHSIDERFVKPDNRAMILISDTPEGLLSQFEAYRPPAVHKWIDRAST